MIVAASYRTDIVNYYTPWLINRLRDGYALVPSPVAPGTVYRVGLTPREVDCLVCCSKNYAPLLPHLPKLLETYPLYCQYTITPYGPDVEPHVPAVQESITTLKRLSAIVGPQRVAWRYDPILVDGAHSAAWHLASFRDMAGQLAPFVGRCIISFVTIYGHVARNSPALSAVPDTEREAIACGIGQTAAKLGLVVQTCGDNGDYSRFGIRPSGCVTAEILAMANGIALPQIPLGHKRPGCACLKTVDLGMYDSCPNGCLYCYANTRDAARAFARHAPDSVMLIGRPTGRERLLECGKGRQSGSTRQRLLPGI